MTVAPSYEDLRKQLDEARADARDDAVRLLKDKMDLWEANAQMAAALRSGAELCDHWADESRQGGWSTHQVDANRCLAKLLRDSAALSQEPPASHAPGLRDDVIEECAKVAESGAGWAAYYHRTPGISLDKAIAAAIRALKGAE